MLALRVALFLGQLVRFKWRNWAGWWCFLFIIVLIIIIVVHRCSLVFSGWIITAVCHRYTYVFLTSLLEQPFHEEGHHGKDEQPGVLPQEGEDLTRGFEDIAHDRADEPGQEGAQLLPDSLKPIS